nr:unnamed protein product [Callosobruchus analis]
MPISLSEVKHMRNYYYYLK